MSERRTEHETTAADAFAQPWQRFVELDASQFVETDDGQRVIRDVVFSTEDVDSHGSIIKQDGWDLARYASNPVLDWMHASTSYGKPSPDDLLGQGRNVRVDAAKLVGDLHFASDALSSIAGKVYLQMKAGLLKGLSVAFIPQQVAWKMIMPDGKIVDEPPHTAEGDLLYYTLRKSGAKDLLIIERAELTAIGVVMVPSNPNTLANGIAALRAAKPKRLSQEEAMRRVKDEGRSAPQDNETSPAPAPAAVREIADEIKQAAMKAASVAGEAISTAAKALGEDDEAAAKTACQGAYDACEACAHAFGAVVPEYVKAKEQAEHDEEKKTDGEPDGDEDTDDEEKAIAASFVRELTGKDDEASQRGVIEAWRKSHDELVQARATIASLQAEVSKLSAGSRAQQVAALLDAHARKLTPAERKSYEARSYGSDEDMAWLRSHLETLPERAELAPATAQLPVDTETLNTEERAVAKMFGMSPAAYLEHKRKLAAEGRERDDDEG